MPHGRASSEASRFKLHPELLRLARGIAEAYSDEEIQSLIERCKGRGHALGLSHLIRLITIRDEKLRKQLERETLDKGWSLSRLDREILKRFGNRMKTAGRRRVIPSKKADAYLEIARQCDGGAGCCFLLATMRENKSRMVRRCFGVFCHPPFANNSKSGS